MLWASCMQPHPYQNLHWYPLTNTKIIWLKSGIAYFTKCFQSIFTVGGWRMYPFNLPLLAPAYIPTQSCKRASFWRLNPAPARNHKPEPGSSPTFIFKARFSPESKIYRGSSDMRNCVLTKNVVCSGDSRIKKLGGALRGQGKSRRANIKCLSCMVIFRCNEDWFPMFNPIKPNIGLRISSEPSPESLQIV